MLEPRNDSYSMRMTAREHNALMECSDILGIPASTIIRNAVMEYYSNHRKELCEKIRRK